MNVWLIIEVRLWQCTLKGSYAAFLIFFFFFFNISLKAICTHYEQYIWSISKKQHWFNKFSLPFQGSVFIESGLCWSWVKFGLSLWQIYSIIWCRRNWDEWELINGTGLKIKAWERKGGFEHYIKVKSGDEDDFYADKLFTISDYNRQADKSEKGTPDY